MGRLDGKIALITGAARGTGAAIAERFAAEGATVVLSDILDERGAATATKTGGSNGNARYVHLDVTSEQEWAAVADDVRAHEGRLDILVNNAAILHLSVIEVTATDTFNRVMSTNVLGSFLGIRTCSALMRKGGGGSIVNIGSIDSVHGTPATAAYTASKFAVLGLTKVAAMELGKYGIRVNCLCPGAGSDEMISEAITVAEPGLTGPAPGPGELPATKSAGDGGVDDDWFLSQQPISRWGRPADMAGAALYFASDDSSFCSGASLVVDGGRLAGMYTDIPGVFTAGLDRSSRGRAT